MSSSTDPVSADAIKVGYIRRAHGVKGSVVVRPLTDDSGLFAPGAEFITDCADLPHATVVTVRPHPDGLLVDLDGVADRNRAEGLKGTSFFVARSQRRDLGPDEYWPDQLIGLQVVDTGGGDLGTIAGVVIGGPQDRLQVRGESGEFEIPFVAALVPVVDIVAGRVVVELPPGLLPE